MRIRQFPQTMTTDYVQGIWNHLKAAIQEIQRKNNSGLSFEELYRNAYTMVLHKHGDKLYSGTKEQVTKHLTEAVRPTIVASTTSDNTLQVLLNSWVDHQTSMTMVRDILMYMDRVHVHANSIDNVETMGIKLFRDQILHFPAVSATVKRLLLQRVDEDRKGLNSHLHSFSVKEICTMLIHLGVSSTDVYKKIFEDEFLLQTNVFYKEEAETVIKSSSASDYVKKVMTRLDEEDKRTRQFLDPVSCEPVKKVVIEVMVKNCAAEIVDMQGSGVVSLIENDRIEDLKRMHQLLLLDKTLHSRNTLITSVENKLFEEGKKIVSEHLQDPTVYIEMLIRLKNRYDWIIERAFSEEKKEYKSAQTKTFEKFMNGKDARSAEYLVQYIDTHFRKSKPSAIRGESMAIGGNADGPEPVVSLLKNGDEEQFKNQCIVLFRLLQEKDSFEQYYKDSLANRMLSDKVSNDDLEFGMIGQLRTECGTTFTTKLESMLKDRKNYTQLNNDYKNTRQTAAQRVSVELNCKTLTSVMWPLFLTKDLTASMTTKAGDQVKKNYTDEEHFAYFPPEMQDAWADYKRFYLGRHQGRRLTLLPIHGSCVVQFSPLNHPKKRKCTITTFPTFTLILAKFNQKPSWKYIELLNAVPNYDHSKFKAIISCLTNGKHKILKAEKSSSSTSMAEDGEQSSSTKSTPRGANIGDNDTITVNDDFDCKLVRIVIMPKFKSKEQRDNTNRQEAQLKIDQDRRHEIEAAIVRTMKARKEYQHNQLVAEVIDQLNRRFKPEVSVIKQKIEGLIEREYIRRKQGDATMYEYLA